MAQPATATVAEPAIGDLAVIGDGRTCAIVTRTGSISWLCLPDLDSAPTFARLVSGADGGELALHVDEAISATQRYLPDTNVLETTIEASTGWLRVTDALLLPSSGFSPQRELARRFECIAGSVTLRVSVVPRSGIERSRPRLGYRSGVPIATTSADAIAVRWWGPGSCDLSRLAGSITCTATLRQGDEGLLALAHATGEPLLLPGHAEVRRRFSETIGYWRSWTSQRSYDGPWKPAVLRSVLVLKLLSFAPSGAIAAAATTSLPEAIGAGRNWDYRLSWLRDSAFALNAFMSLGCLAEARAFLWWLMHASRTTHPHLVPAYRLDGSNDSTERVVPWTGFRSSRPVRVGNDAARQRQLDSYGYLFATIRTFAARGGSIDGDHGRHLAELANFICDAWQLPDSGIWEVPGEPRQFTHSKMMCWVALDCARRLAVDGMLPSDGMHRWHATATSLRRFIEQECWSAARRSYVQAAGSADLDASLLLAAALGYCDATDERFLSTMRAIEHELGAGHGLLYRYRSDDGLDGDEGCFLACSFWLVDALARSGDVDRACELMERLLALAPPTGLYAEEIDPHTFELLGNTPQALVHIGLISAAQAVQEALST